MKCINCNQEIPDTSNVCPFCNNKVEPLVNSAQALGIQNNVLPNTPENYVLPKDQIKQETNNMPSPPTMESVANTSSTTPQSVQPSIPTPPPMENIPSPPSMGSDDNTVGNLTVDPTSSPTYTNPTQLNLENVDLNANPQATSIDLTKSGEKIAATMTHNQDQEANKKKKKLIIIICIFVVVFALVGGGLYFYFTQYQSADKRINKAIDRLFNFTTTLNNTKIENGTGSYIVRYTSNANNDELSFNIEGKYGYDLPNKKIDVIANIKNYNHNGELLDDELNTELYLENSRAYLLLQNFDTKYYYTEIADSKKTIDDIESRFNDPDKLLLFNLVNTLYNNGLEAFSKDYPKYIDNLSQNDINYVNVINGLKQSVKDALNSATIEQKFEGGKNVVRISLKSYDSLKTIYTRMLESVRANNNAYPSLAKLYGGDSADLYKALKNLIDAQDYKPSNVDIVITTDAFKQNLISASLPIVVGNDTYVLNITPNGSGLRFIANKDNKKVLDIKYSKSSSKTSTTETKKYVIDGEVLTNDVVNKFNLELEFIRDINPNKINVVTRNSIDYQYLTANDFNEMANKFKEYGKLGIVFQSYYKGAPVEEEPPLEVVSE
jgi:hypothetical protein